MFKMLNDFFTMFSTLFGAGNKVAMSLDNLASVGVTKSEVFKEKTEAELAVQRIELAKQLKDVKALSKA